MEPENKFPKKRLVLWIVLGLVLFGGANAMAFSDGYRNFVSELKIATLKSWEDASGRNDGFKLAAKIELEPQNSKPVTKEENEVITIPKPKKTLSANLKEVATSIQSLPEKIASIIATSSNLIVSTATPPKTEPTPPPQNQNPEPEVPVKEEPKTVSNLVISVVQIRGAKVDNDFIILFNPNDEPLDISGWNLRKKTKTGTNSSIKVFDSGSIIPAYGSFIWANSKEDFHLSLNSNTWSTATIAANNSTALFDKEKVIIDSVAWGEGHTNPYIEGSAVSNPESGMLIKRKFNGEVPIDTDDNSADFEVR